MLKYALEKLGFGFRLVTTGRGLFLSPTGEGFYLDPRGKGLYLEPQRCAFFRLLPEMNSFRAFISGFKEINLLSDIDIIKYVNDSK